MMASDAYSVQYSRSVVSNFFRPHESQHARPPCPSTEEWIKKMWYIYTMEYYSAIKKNEIMPFAATWMDPDSVILSEVSQKEKEKYRTTSLIFGI